MKSDAESAEPQLPSGFEKYLHMKELDVGIKAVSVSPAIPGEVTLDAGTVEGVLPRMRFRKPPPLDGWDLVILETSAHETKGIVRMASETAAAPKVGDRFRAPCSACVWRRVCQLAGKVTIDGNTPKGDGDILVMLYDRKEVRRRSARPLAICRPNGEFSFSTYISDDGGPLGSYVLLFARLKRSKNGYVGPDGLGNLYNDPDKNLEKPGFVIEHKRPGRTDYAFDLKTRGVDPISTPGPHALTQAAAID